MDPNKEENKEEPLKYSEVASMSLDEILAGAKPIEENPETPAEEKPEEKPQETPAPTEEKKEETPATPTPPAETTVEKQPTIDAEELTKKLGSHLKDEISNDVADKVIKAMGVDKEEKATPPWEKENRNPTYKEAINWAMDQAKPELKQQLKDELKSELKKEVLDDLNKEVEDEEKKEAETKKATEERNKQVAGEWKNYWDKQFSELEADNKIPKIVDQNDNRKDSNGLPLDPGKRARVEILQAMTKASTERQAKGLLPVTSVLETFALHYKPSSDQPAGADAPVFGAKKSVSSSDEKTLKYSEVRNTSIDDILAEAYNQRG